MAKTPFEKEREINKDTDSTAARVVMAAVEDAPTPEPKPSSYDKVAKPATSKKST